MFRAADPVVISKTDLLPYVDFHLETLTKHARSLNPGPRTIALSVRSGANLDLWYAWLHAL